MYLFNRITVTQQLPKRIEKLEELVEKLQKQINILINEKK